MQFARIMEGLNNHFLPNNGKKREKFPFFCLLDDLFKNLIFRLSGFNTILILLLYCKTIFDLFDLNTRRVFKSRGESAAFRDSLFNFGKNGLIMKI